MSDRNSPLQISQSGAGIGVSGEIDAATVPDFSNAIQALFDGSSTGADAVVDMAGVTFIDSSGLRSLIRAHHHAESTGKRLVILNPSTVVSRLIELSGLNDLFHAAHGT